MALRLQLPQNFRVRAFGSSRNSNGIGKYLVANEGNLAIDMVERELTHFSETCFAYSLSRAVAREPLSEDIVVSPCSNLHNDGEFPVIEKKKGGSARKRLKTVPGTITRRWQEVWACRFSWVEAEFNSNGDLCGVVCVSCTAITGSRKVLVLKADNLEKHEGKRMCRDDGVPLPHLKKGDTLVKADYKHVKNCKLWAMRKNAGSLANQLTIGLENDFKRKGV